MKHPRRKVLFAFVALLALIAGFLVVEHFRGSWMLKRWKGRMAAKGEELRAEKLAPRVPFPDENGMPQLIWTSSQLGSFLPDLQPPTGKYAVPGKCIVITRLNSWPVRNSRPTNVTWAAVAEELAACESRLDAVLEALQSQAFNANIHYHAGFNAIPFNHLTRIKSLSLFLSAAALHDLHQRQNDSALRKLQGLLALPEVLKDEPIIISQVVRLAVMQVAFTVTWQAVQCDGWSDAQLAALQEAWTRYNFLPAIEKAFAMERAMAVVEYARFRDADLPLSQFLDPMGGMVAAPKPSLMSWDWLAEMFNSRDHLFTPFWKFAWSEHDELYWCETMQSVLEAHRRGVPLQSGNRVVATIERIEGAGLGVYDGLRFVLARSILGALTSSMRRAWMGQTTAEIARTAIALKRYELRNGQLPCSLAALVPEFLPRHPVDYMDGAPLRYCLEPDGRFLLYSVGSDGRDDGGDPGSSSNPNFQNGRDLLWPQPASEVETEVWRILRK